MGDVPQNLSNPWGIQAVGLRRARGAGKGPETPERKPTSLSNLGRIVTRGLKTVTKFHDNKMQGEPCHDFS